MSKLDPIFQAIGISAVILYGSLNAEGVYSQTLPNSSEERTATVVFKSSEATEQSDPNFARLEQNEQARLNLGNSTLDTVNLVKQPKNPSLEFERSTSALISQAEEPEIIETVPESIEEEEPESLETEPGIQQELEGVEEQPEIIDESEPIYEPEEAEEQPEILETVPESIDEPPESLETEPGIVEEEPGVEEQPEIIDETEPEPDDPNAPVRLELNQLNPNPDLLITPDTPEEVEIDVTEPITLEQAIELGLDNNQDLREAELNLERSLRELDEARAELYPNLALQSNYSFGRNANAELGFEGNRDRNRRRRIDGRPIDDLSSEEIDLVEQQQGLEITQGGGEDDTAQFTGDLTLSYDIYTGGQRGANIRRAKRVVDFNGLDLERATEQVIFEIKRDYYSLQNADSQVEIERGAVEDAQQTLRDAELLEQAGLGTRFDVLRAEVELANAQQRLTSANATQATARRQLVETLSLGERVDIVTADEIAPVGDWDLSLESSIVLAYQNRAELEQFLVNREINDAQKDIALSQIRPQLSIFGALDFIEVTGDGFDPTTGYSVGATLQWTLFDGGAARARARQEDVDIAIAENNYSGQRDEVRIEVEQAFFDLEANQDNISTSQQAVELAEESLRLARLRFQAGVGTQTDVIEAQTELTTARGNLLNAIVQYNQSFNELQRAITNIPDDQIDIPESQLDVPDGEVEIPEEQ